MNRPVNLLELKPVRNVSWETHASDQVVLLIPKFTSRWAVRYVLPLLAKPNFRIKLDAYGSYLWNQFDGQTTIQEMGDRMKAHFGDAIEPVFDRIGKFLKFMEKEKFVLMDRPEGHQQHCLN